MPSIRLFSQQPDSATEIVNENASYANSINSAGNHELVRRVDHAIGVTIKRFSDNRNRLAVDQNIRNIVVDGRNDPSVFISVFIKTFLRYYISMANLTYEMAIDRNPAKVSGEWLFRNTRVPISSLFENLKDGVSIDQYLEWFPGVKREQVLAVLDHEIEQLKKAA